MRLISRMVIISMRKGTLSNHKAFSPVTLFCIIVNILPYNRGLCFTKLPPPFRKAQAPESRYRSCHGGHWGNILSNRCSAKSIKPCNPWRFSDVSRLRYFSQNSDLMRPTDSAQTDSVSAIYQTYHVGDWAGHISNFDSISGALIPVPNHLVPEAMIEWGQIPPQLEVISSETLELVNSTLNEWQLRRTTVTVLPDVGCGCDNLETIKSQESILFSVSSSNEKSSNIFYFPRWKSAAKFFPDGVLFLAYQNDAWKALNPNRYKIYVSVPMEKTRDYEHRTRISFEIELGNQVERIFKTPVSIVKERRISNKSSDGSIARGGGLDSQTVSNLVGIDEVNNPFSLEKNTNTFSSEPSMVCDPSKSLFLPGNVLIRHGNSTMNNNDRKSIGDLLLEIAVSSSGNRSSDVPVKRCVVVFPLSLS